MSIQRFRSPALIAALALSAPIVVALPATSGAKAAWTFTPEKGFVDDAIAFSADGGRMAFILSDSATFMEIAVFEVASRKIVKRIPLGAVTRVPLHLHFVGDGAVLLIWSDAQKGDRGADLIRIDDSKKTPQVKGATHLQLVSHEGAEALAAAFRRDNKGGGYQLRAQVHRLSDLRRLRAVTLAVRGDATIKKPALRVLYWGPGLTTLIGLKRGAYDKKRDIRLPDVAVWYDVLRRKELATKTPKKLVQWNRALEMREAHPYQRRFLHVGQTLKPLYLVDERNEVQQVKTPVPWRLYEPKSLKQHESWDGKSLYFSLTIDPVNPDAVARKKADKERADLYRLDPGPKATPLGQVLTDKRRFTWVVGRSHFAYLRKLKGFGRGGKTLELHAVAR